MKKMDKILTKCLHGKKYEDCVFCRLWDYTRTARKHYIDNGEFYPKRGTNRYMYHLYEIRSSAPYGFIQDKYGYDLYRKGKFIKHGKTVKELKQMVIERLG